MNLVKEKKYDQLVKEVKHDTLEDHLLALYSRVKASKIMEDNAK